MFEQNLKNNRLYCEYDEYWLIFENEFAMEFYGIQSFTKSMMGQPFKMKVLTPICVGGIAKMLWKNSSK